MADPLASQRAELLGQVAGAQFDLERTLAAMPGTARAEGEQQLVALKNLLRQIGRAGAADLIALRAEIGIAVTAAQGGMAQARSMATAEAAAILAEVRTESRREVQSFLHDFYERKIFEPYLHFDSAQEEADYHKREEAYRKAIEAALAKGTAEGDLEAIGLSKEQLADAGAHGADRSPEFSSRMQQFDQQETKLEQAMANSRRMGSTTEMPSTRPSPEASLPSDTDMAKALATLQSVGPIAPMPSEQTGHGLSKDASAALARSGRA